jgi:hypothetical protein
VILGLLYDLYRCYTGASQPGQPGRDQQTGAAARRRDAIRLEEIDLESADIFPSATLRGPSAFSRKSSDEHGKKVVLLYHLDFLTVLLFFFHQQTLTGTSTP